MKSLKEKWTKWINFGDIYEYYGLLDFTNTTSRKELITFNGQNGRPFQDNGFRLRSKEYNYGFFKTKKIDNIIYKRFKLKKYELFLSISDEKDYSIAFTILQKI